MKELLHDLQLCYYAAIRQWKFCRAMRKSDSTDYV